MVDFFREQFNHETKIESKDKEREREKKKGNERNEE